MDYFMIVFMVVWSILMLKPTTSAGESRLAKEISKLRVQLNEHAFRLEFLEKKVCAAAHQETTSSLDSELQ